MTAEHVRWSARDGGVSSKSTDDRGFDVLVRGKRDHTTSAAMSPL
jgi:hypothetical protein